MRYKCKKKLWKRYMRLLLRKNGKLTLFKKAEELEAKAEEVAIRRSRAPTP